MVELQILRSPQSAAQPPPPNPNRTGIEINWGEAVAETIEIRHRHTEIATQGCGINPAGAGPGCRQGQDAQLALAGQVQKILASRPGR
jgi:hypothetical protein